MRSVSRYNLCELGLACIVVAHQLLMQHFACEFRVYICDDRVEDACFSQTAIYEISFGNVISAFLHLAIVRWIKVVNKL